MRGEGPGHACLGLVHGCKGRRVEALLSSRTRLPLSLCSLASQLRSRARSPSEQPPHAPGAPRPPGLLLREVAALERDASAVHQLLARARDRDALLTALPLLLEPRTLISVLVTVEKWWVVGGGGGG